MNKDQLYTHIDLVLKSINFKAADDRCWISEISQNRPNMQVSVNGQAFNVPVEPENIRRTIKIVGEGSVDSREFAQILVMIEKSTQENVWEEIWTGIPEECIYFDDIQSFDCWISQLL